MPQSKKHKVRESRSGGKGHFAASQAGGGKSLAPMPPKTETEAALGRLAVWSDGDDDLAKDMLQPAVGKAIADRKVRLSVLYERWERENMPDMVYIEKCRVAAEFAASATKKNTADLHQMMNFEWKKLEGMLQVLRPQRGGLCNSFNFWKTVRSEFMKAFAISHNQRLKDFNTSSLHDKPEIKNAYKVFREQLNDFVFFQKVWKEVMHNHCNSSMDAFFKNAKYRVQAHEVLNRTVWEVKDPKRMADDDVVALFCLEQKAEGGKVALKAAASLPCERKADKEKVERAVRRRGGSEEERLEALLSVADVFKDEIRRNPGREARKKGPHEAGGGDRKDGDVDGGNEEEDGDDPDYGEETILREEDHLELQMDGTRSAVPMVMNGSRVRNPEIPFQVRMLELTLSQRLMCETLNQREKSRNASLGPRLAPRHQANEGEGSSSNLSDYGAF